MPSSNPSWQLQSNLDLFRASPQEFSPYQQKALGWLQGSASFPRPISIHFDLTLRCNARCLHCKQWSWPRHKEMGPEQIKTLFGIFQGWGVQTVTLGGGNPLLSENLCLALECARQANIKVGIISEGAKLSPAASGCIAENAAWIRFSLDGPSPEIHDRIRNTPGLFELVMEDIAQLKAANPHLHIGINHVVQRQNYLHVAEMIELAEQRGVDALLFKIPHGEDPHRAYLLDEDEWARFAQLSRQMLQNKPGSGKNNLPQLLMTLTHSLSPQDCASGRPVKHFYSANQIHCFVPLFFLACDSEGNLYPCDYLQADTRAWGHYQELRSSYCLGNVLEDGERIFERLDSLMRKKIHNLPTSGFDECGCCTRFYQLNSALSRAAGTPGSPNEPVEDMDTGLSQNEGLFL